MVVLIAGSSHTGKTALAGRLLKKYKMPFLSIDHLKMGLIRSGQTALTPEDDQALTDYLWPIVREMVKTVIENGQDLIVEGCYIPFDWEQDFNEAYRKEIRYICLIMDRGYIENHFLDIKKYACTAEKRLDDGWYTKEMLIEDNARNLELCRQYGCPYLLIRDRYQVDFSLDG